MRKSEVYELLRKIEAPFRAEQRDWETTSDGKLASDRYNELRLRLAIAIRRRCQMLSDHDAGLVILAFADEWGCQ